MTREQRAHVVLGPLRIWAGLLLLLGATLLFAYLPKAPLKLEVGLAIAAAKALLIVMFFMQLRRAAWLIRLAAFAGLVWASFLFMFAFSDYLTR